MQENGTVYGFLTSESRTRPISYIGIKYIDLYGRKLKHQIRILDGASSGALSYYYITYMLPTYLGT